jgi:hypothetical protein
MSNAIAAERDIIQSVINPGYVEIQAQATASDGFVVQQDFGRVIKKYVRENTILWQLIQKQAAEANIVREILETPSTAPTVGYLNKTTLNPVVNPANQNNYDLTDPGQEIKALGGIFSVNHYAQSLYIQQNSPFGDIVARKTDRILIQTMKALERGLFNGNTTTDPLSFNGLSAQMPVANRYQIDITAGDSIVNALRGIVRLATSNEDLLLDSSHIFTSGLGVELLSEELDQKLQYHNLEIIRPGFSVPMLETQTGALPIVISPYIRDKVIPAAGGAPAYDEVTFYIFNIKDIAWHGVIPFGGKKTFNPQIFDISRYVDGPVPVLLEKRMVMIYGTLYVGNRGQSLFELKVRIPAGRAAKIV